LHAKYDDESWRANFFETHHLVQFLSQCILKENYKIPDDAVSLIPLTEFGTEVLNKLVRKNDVNAKVARLLCLLNFAHREPLVDFTKIDTEDVRKFIDRQIRDGEILFPPILGRDLYDRASELFEDPRASLPHNEVLELLDGLPVGVFQSGPFVSGPFGLIRSSEQRWFAPVRTVPMYHCAELTCRTIHYTRLSSDMTAEVNDKAPTMRKVLDSYGDDECEWSEFIEEIAGLEGVDFDDETSEPLFLALGDLFGDDELRVLLADLLDNTGGSVREHVEPLGLVGASADIVEKLQRAQLIQLLLLATNRDLTTRIDHLIRAAEKSEESHEPYIQVDPGEIRRLMTSERTSFGVFGLYPEVSNLGIRFKSDSFPLGPMRLKRLIESLYDLSDPREIGELQWQLRSTEGDDPHERLEEFLRSASPQEVVEQLLLSRRVNQTTAADRLGVSYESCSGDKNFVDSILWKLGFYPSRSFDSTSDFWDHHGRLKRFVDTAGVGSRVDIVDLRSRAINCFVALEGLLENALCFSVWALTTDHLSSSRPFVFANWLERQKAFDRLNAFEDAKQDRADETTRLGKKNTLGSLIPAFGTLRDFLIELQADAQAYVRDKRDYPRYSAHTTLKSFPFNHCVPFLDLLPRSQARIIESLEYVRKTLEAAQTAFVRNDFGHYRPNSPDLNRVEATIVAMERSVRRLEGDGLVPLPFKAVADHGDDWGRRIFTLRNSKGREVAFARPSAYDWAQMPSLRGEQFILPSAVFAQPNEMLRFRAVYNTPYAMYWERYPVRRRRRSAVSGPSSESHSDA
jgi:hypothetical protein